MSDTTKLRLWESKHRSLLFFVPFLLGVALRIYPSILFQAPYSTDSWTPIRIAELLLAKSPVPLGGGPTFGSYTIYWPGGSIFGAVASLLLNGPPIAVMPILVPIASSVTLLIFFLIAEKLTRSTLAASIATLLFSTAGFYAIFTAGVTNEGFANPFYMLCLYLLLLWKSDYGTISLFALSSFALVLSHHATTFIFVAIAGAICLTEFVLLKVRGERTGGWPMIPAITAVIAILYFLIYADGGIGALGSLLTMSNFVIVFSFLIVLMLPVLYFTIGPPRRMIPIEEGIVMGVIIAVLVVSSRANLIPLEPTLPPDVLLLFALPYIVVGFFSILGNRILQRQNRMSYGFVGAWFAVILSLMGFGAFGLTGSSIGGLDIVYRLFDFLYPPAAILASVAIYKALSGGGPRFNFIKPMLVILVIGISAATAFQTYAASVEQSNLLGGSWVYHPSDLSSGSWLRNATTSVSGFSIAGDTREVDLLTGYFGIDASSPQLGYEYLAGIGTTVRPPYVVTYSLMSRNGYDLDPYAFPLPSTWMQSLENGSSLLYSNGNDFVWK